MAKEWLWGRAYGMWLIWLANVIVLGLAGAAQRKPWEGKAGLKTKYMDGIRMLLVPVGWVYTGQGFTAFTMLFTLIFILRTIVKNTEQDNCS